MDPDQNPTVTLAYTQKIRQLARWISDSGIQISSGEDQGALCAWIERPSGSPSFLYAEITGYLISMITNLRHTSNEPQWISMACDAGNWLVSVAQHASGLILGRKYGGPNEDFFSFENRHVALFDNCAVGYGLMNLYKMTGEQRYLQHALEIADVCLDVFFDEDCRLLGPVFSINERAICEQQDHWSAHTGSFLLKCTLFLVSASRESRDPRLSQAVDTLLSLALERQLEDGRFRTSRSAMETHLHPHSYTIEGLLLLAYEFQRADLLDRAKVAIEFSFRVCMSDPAEIMHSWPTADYYCGASLRCDAIVQSLRAYYIMKLIDDSYAPNWEDQVDQLVTIVDSFGLAGGGTSYGRSTNGSLIEHANSWCHIFRVEMEIFRSHCLSSLGLPGSELIIA
jgi:hypothetical protein